jgi:tetratricopeptide (TPR) repeat protein
LGNLEDLEAALNVIQEAVELTPEGHPSRPGCLQNLVASFSDRYQRLGNLEDLEAWLNTIQEAVELTSKGHPDRPGCLQSLALSFGDRYRRLGNLEDLEAALNAIQEAVELTPKAHPDRPGRLQSLAENFGDRYRKLGNLEDLKAVHIHYSSSFETPSTIPQNSWDQALQWASFATEFESSYCIPAYRAAFHILPELLWIGHSISVRHDAIHRLGIAQATSSAIQTCIKLSNFTAPVEIMEQGLATTFQQMLQLKTDVDVLPPDLAEVFQTLSSQLYSGTSVNPMKVVNERNKLLEDIRKQPGLEYFLLPKPYSVLCHASQGGPVVVLNSHADHCDGIIILNPTSEPIHVPLPNVTLELLNSQRDILKELLGRCSVRNRGEALSSRLFGQREDFSSKPTQECFKDMLGWLWTHIVGPVYQAFELVRGNMDFALSQLTLTVHTEWYF